jgi:hypothetical protein
MWGGAGTPTLHVIASAAEAALREARHDGIVQPVIRAVGPPVEPSPVRSKSEKPPQTQTSLPKPFR